MGTPLNRILRLASDQSPNLDRTIPDLALGGNESFLGDFPEYYIAVLTADLHCEKAMEYRFRLASDCLASLRVAGNNVITESRSKRGTTATTRLAKGLNKIEVIAAVNDLRTQLEVRWSPDGETEFTPIPSGVLSSESFYFRPTSPGGKRLIATDDRPGRNQKVSSVYPSLNLETIHPQEVDVPVGGLATLADGTLVVATFNARRLRAPRPQEEPDGELWLYHDAGGDPCRIHRERIATDLYEPSGVCVVDDAIYISQRLEVTRYDKRSDSSIWEQSTVASGWESNDFHGRSALDCCTNQPLAIIRATCTWRRALGWVLVVNPPNHGSVWRIDLSLPAGNNVEAITGGHRTPNGLGWGPQGTVFVTDNQGEYTPANELNLVRDGAFYGFFQPRGEGASPSPFQPAPTRRDNPQAVTEAAVWLPQDEIANSPSQPLMVPEKWPFAGQLLVGDVKYGGLNRIFLEQIDGDWQGAAFRFTQGCEGGINRMAFGPQGELYVGAIGGDHASSWNWVDPQGHKTYEGLQRLKPNGMTTFDFEYVKAVSGGFEIRFTKPIDKGWLSNAENYELRQWSYKATPGYGGSKVEVEPLEVMRATVGSNGRSVVLEIPGLKSNRVVHFLIDPVSLDGEEIWSAEAWYTLRRLPGDPSDTTVKHVVFVTGDDEYGSEVSMPMIASILERQPGFRATVLKSVNEKGERDRHGHSIPGLRSLRDADAAVFFMRFRALPRAQVEEIERYISSGRPVIGLRTSSHAFQYSEGPFQRLNEEFGNEVLGQQWISHYGHGTTSRAMVESKAESHPILRGVPAQFDLHSWLYVTSNELHPLPTDCSVLLNGRALRGDEGEEQEFGERQQLAWTREISITEQLRQRVFYMSLGHPHDFMRAPARRLLLQAIYWVVGEGDTIPPEGLPVPLPSGYDPPDPK